MAESINESHLLRALSRLSILEEEIEDSLPARKRELKRLKRRASRRRSSRNSSLEVSLDEPRPRTSAGTSLSPIRDELIPSSAGEEDSEDASVIEPSYHEEGQHEDADDLDEEEAEDEETRRLAEEIRMLEEETARLALEAIDEDESYDEDGATTEEEDEPQAVVDDEGGAVVYDSEEEEFAEPELPNVGGETEQHNRSTEDGEESTEDEDETEDDDDPTIRGVLAAVAQLQLTDGGDEPEDVTVDEQETKATSSVVEVGDGADAGDEEELVGPAAYEQADEDDVKQAAEENEESSEQENEEDEEEERNHQDERESERASKGSEEKPSRLPRAQEEVREEEEEDKPVVRRRLRKLAEVKAERESKKKDYVPMFSDESEKESEEEEEEEEEAPSDKRNQRGREARPAAKGGMMDKLRMLARQTGGEAIEDAAQPDSSESEAEEARDDSEEEEHDSEFPTDEPVIEGSDYEAECNAEDDDEKRPPTPEKKAKTLQKVKTERDVKREGKNMRESEASEQEEAEEADEDEESEEEEETPSWKRLRKFVEVKDKPRTIEKKKEKKKSDSSGKWKAATTAELKGKAKDAVKTEAKKGKNADEDFVEEEVERVQLWKGLSIPAKMWDGLYPYQKRGVEFMWSLYTKKTGGILGDEMGLGKTIQALVLVLGALTSGRAKRVLIVVPLSVMKNWENELMRWSDNGAMLESRGMGICIMHGAMNKKKNEIKDKVFHHEGGLCFTTYGNIPTKLASFVSINWDIVLLDEGHKIKNHRIGLSQSMRRIPSTTRILLTGTPIQNNLMELWSLFDYTCKGQLLGTIHQFGRQFEQPIKYATYKCASAEEKQLSHELSKQLRHILAPHFLRREKKDVFNTNGSTSKADAKAEGELSSASPSSSSSEERQQQALTTRMNDFIVWLSLSPVQEKLYRSFLASDQVKNVLATTKNVLEGLVLLKKLCDHPRLLTAKNAEAVDAELLATCGFKDWLRDKEADDEDISEKPKRAAKRRQTRATSDDEDDAAEESESSDEEEEQVDHLPVTRQAVKRKQLTTKAKTEISGGRRLAVDEFNTRLPHEVKLRIFGFACYLSDVEEVSRLMLVCSHWRQVASDDALWFPLCRHQSFVDARGRDLQATALANAERREAQLAKEEAREARRMAYTIHPIPDNAEADDESESDADDEDDDEGATDEGARAEGVGNETMPIPPNDASWRECFLRKRRENLHRISAKLVFLMRLLPKLREEGSRVLVFSQSRKMLNIIELLLREGDYSFLRIDGSISKSDERQRRVELFNSDPSYFCFLLTTVVGGIGLNLTGADRVVIVDPSWNPTHDNQAVCRAFRLGQKKNVIVYRLITCGTIEEKIYRRQVFKGAIVQSTMTQKSSLRYFSREELADLFHLGDPRVAQTQKDLHALHAHERVTDEYTDQHIQYLHEIGGVHGISDHDLLFSKTQAVESSAVAKQQAKAAARHLKNQNSDDEGDDDGASDLRATGGNRQHGDADDGAGEATPSSQPRTRGRGEREDEEAKEKEREMVAGSAPPARRRRPRESIVDTALNAFTPPVTVYSRVIEKTRMRKLTASPASSPSARTVATPQLRKTAASSSRPLTTPVASSSSLLASAVRKHATSYTTRGDKENNKPRANAKRLAFDD